MDEELQVSRKKEGVTEWVRQFRNQPKWKHRGARKGFFAQKSVEGVLWFFFSRGQLATLMTGT